MSLRFTDNQGIQALDPNQIIEMVNGNSVVSGADVSINSGTLGQSDTVQVASGTVIVGGSEVSVSQQNVQIDSADPDNPRKDIVVIDSAGNAKAVKGTPEDPEPEGDNKFDLYQPAPPDQDNVDEAVVGEVFVPAGNSSITSSELRDRRLFASASLDSLDIFSTLDLNSNVISNVADPSNAQQAATKSYVDSNVTDSQLDVQDDGSQILTDAEKLNFKNGQFTASDDGSGVAGIQVDESGVDHDNLNNYVANEHIDHSTTNVNAGTSLTGGGSIDSDVTINVDETTIDHDNLTNFVANEHIDHSSVSITGTGALTGGGDLTSSRTIDVASNGIGTSELDESAAFSFSNLGPTTISGGDLDISSNDIDNFNNLVGSSSVTPQIRTDGTGTGKFQILDNNTTTQFLIFEEGTNQTTKFGGDANLDSNNLNNVSSINNGGSPISFNDTLALESGVNISFTGNAAIRPDNSLFVDIDNDGGGGDVFEIRSGADGSRTTEFVVNQNGDVDVQNGDLDLNSNNLNNVASLDNGGSEININDNLSVNSNEILNADDIRGAGTSSDQRISFQANMDYVMDNAGNHRFFTEKSDGSLTQRLVVFGGTDKDEVSVRNANLQVEGSNSIIDESGNPHLTINDSGNSEFNRDILLNDGVLKVDDVNGEQGRINKFDDRTEFASFDDIILRVGGFVGGSGTERIRINQGGSIDVSGGNISIEGSNSITDGSGNLHLTINDGGDTVFGRDPVVEFGNVLRMQNSSSVAGNALQVTNSDNFFLGAGAAFNNIFLDKKTKVLGETTQPGTSSDPALQIGDSGAGFFINASGEVVVVDEAGNTTTIS